MGDNGVRRAQDVRAGEAQEPESRTQEAVLAAVVLDEAVAVGAAVVLDRQARASIEEIDSTEELAALAVQPCLGLRTWQTREDEQ